MIDAAERDRVPLLIVGSHRPVEPEHPLAQVVARFNREPACTSLALTGLNEFETDALLHDLGVDRASQGLLALVSKATAGNPLFIQEVLHQLREQGALHDVNGYVSCDRSPADLRLPDEVTQAIEARVRGLNADLRGVLATAALLGDQFTLPLLAAVTAREEEALLVLLDEAVALRLLTSEGEQFLFAHPLTRHVAAHALSAPHRQRLHLRIAEALQRLRPNGGGEHDLELAHHLIEAGPVADPAGVAQAAQRAGAQALSAFAWNDAARFYKAAIAAAEGDGHVSVHDLAELCYWAALAHYRDLELGPSLILYARAAEGYRATADARGAARALVERTRALLIDGSTAMGDLIDLGQLEEALTELRDSDPALCGEILVLMADVCFVARQEQRAHAAAQRALEIGQRIADDRLCAQAEYSRAQALWQGLSYRAALAAFRSSLQFAQRSGDPTVAVWPLARIPLILVGLGQVAEAVAAAPEAFAGSRQTHFQTHYWGEYSLALAALESAAVIRGDRDASERHAGQVMQMVRRSQYGWSGVLALPALASRRATAGAWVEAEDAIALFVEPGRLFDAPGPVVQAMAWFYQQLIRVYAGETTHVQAEVAANPALMDLPEHADLFSIDVFCAVVEIADGIGDAALAARPYGALRRVSELGVVLTGGWLFLIPRLLGVSAGLARRWEEAERHFEMALAVAGDAGAEPELARTRLDYARMLSARGRRGDRRRLADLLRQAALGFAALEMQPFLRQSIALAAALKIELPWTRAGAARYPDGLSDWEAQALIGFARGRSDRQIADDLLLRPETIARYAVNIEHKTGATRDTAVRYAAGKAILSLPAAEPAGPELAATEPGAPPPAELTRLSRRELEVLRLLAVGKSNREIAADLSISVNTVFRHVENIFGKTGVANRTEASFFAQQHDLLG